jgi:hypothetical protein
MASGKDTKRVTGPEPERVKIEGNWKVAVAKALKKERPKDGWPKPQSRYKKRK